MPVAPKTMLYFAGCMVLTPLRSSPKWRRRFTPGAFRTLQQIHTFGQTFQVIDILRGQKAVPTELLPYAFLSPRTRVIREGYDFSNVDMVLVEMSSNVELLYRGYVLHQYGLNQTLSRPALSGSAEQKRLANAWMNKGLRGFNEEVRAESAAALVKTVTGDTERDELNRSLISDLRSEPTDILGSLTRLKAMFPCPIGVVLRHFRYMPDGRTISWPPEFVSDVQIAAGRLNIPVFDPAPMVVSAGVDKTIADDGHYTKDFAPVVGNAIAQFALSIM